jgi:hypothetical protein
VDISGQWISVVSDQWSVDGDQERCQRSAVRSQRMWSSKLKADG